jgi:hypothetical protein
VIEEKSDVLRGVAAFHEFTGKIRGPSTVRPRKFQVQNEKKRDDDVPVNLDTKALRHGTSI